MPEFDGLRKHEKTKHSLVPPKTECSCPCGGGIKNGDARYLSCGGTQKKKSTGCDCCGTVPPFQLECRQAPPRLSCFNRSANSCRFCNTKYNDSLAIIKAAHRFQNCAIGLEVYNDLKLSNLKSKHSQSGVTPMHNKSLHITTKCKTTHLHFQIHEMEDYSNNN